MHGIREAMAPHPSLFERMGGIVEIDEVYIGGREKNRHASKRKESRGRQDKEKRCSHWWSAATPSCPTRAALWRRSQLCVAP